MPEIADGTPTEVADVQTDDVDFSGWDEDVSASDADMDGWDDDSEVQEEETDEPSDEPGEEAEESEEKSDSESEEETTDPLEDDTPKLEDATFKYLGEEKKLGDLPTDEVIKLVQKGQNHDRIQEQLEPFREIAELWSKMGEELSLDKMGEALLNDVYKRLADHNNTSPELERRSHELDTREKRAKIQRELDAQQAKESQLAQEKQDAMYKRFAKEYPDVKVDKIPAEVKRAVKNGEDLVSAYMKYENKSLKSSNAKLKKQIENKKSSFIKPSKGSGMQTGDDPMFDGWND